VFECDVLNTLIKSFSGLLMLFVDEIDFFRTSWVRLDSRLDLEDVVV
jgi:hypothetical protein